MKIIKQTSPYIHKKVSVERMMFDVLIALWPLVIFAVLGSGFKALSVILTSIVTMVISEFVFLYMTSKEPYDGSKKTFKYNIKKTYEKATINNILTPCISGIIYALLLPAGAPVYVVIVGALVGIVFGKLVFGGLGNNIFNPAALGRIFVMLAFGSQITYGSSNFCDIIAGGTPLGQVSENITNISNYSLLDMFIGYIPGSMGEVSKALILLCGLYLFIRCSADYRTFLSMIFASIVIIFIASLSIDGVNSLEFTLYHLLSGGLIFGAVFMVTDPVTSPITKPGRILFGTLVASIALIIRFIGAYPEGVAFAILICNMLVPLIDRKLDSKFKFKHAILGLGIIALTGAVIALAI